MIYGKDNKGCCEITKPKKKVSRTISSPTKDIENNNNSSSTSFTASRTSTGGRVEKKDDSLGGFYPPELGATEITDNYVSVGIQPTVTPDYYKEAFLNSGTCQFINPPTRNASSSSYSSNQFDMMDVDKAGPEEGEILTGATGFRLGLTDIILPKLEKFKPQLLIISAGFDGFHTDPLGKELRLSLEDYDWCTKQVSNECE
jgi:hypothetical protein